MLYTLAHCTIHCPPLFFKEGEIYEKIYNNVINGIQKNDVSVVLMHDSEYKGTTLEATPLIIEKLQEMKALILPITADTIPIHHNIN